MVQEILKEKVALITGGATGIGFATAALFLRQGAKVIIAERRQSEGQKAIEELQKISPSVHFIQTDVSKSSDIKNLVTGTVNKYGPLNSAFNNAGIEGSFAN